MPGRTPREEESILSQLQLHRVAELHRVVEARARRQEASESDRDRERDRDRDRDRTTLYRSALLHVSGAASRYHNPMRDLYPLDDDPSEDEQPSAARASDPASRELESQVRSTARQPSPLKALSYWDK